MSRFGIIGIGWLGKAFADFYSDHDDLWGTSRHPEKFSEAFRERVEVFSFQLKASIQFLPIANSKHLLFTIPPSRIENYADDCISFFKSVLKINPSIRIIYISSTSVYGTQKGKITEKSKTRPKSDNAKKIAEVEDYLLNTNAYILRCGGLIGEGRHPVHYLAGKQNIQKPKAAVNLVHQRDVCRFIQFLVKKDLQAGVYNLVCPQHPGREEYYQEVAERLSLKRLNFEQDDDREGKVVLPEKSLEATFRFEYSSPFEMPLVRK